MIFAMGAYVLIARSMGPAALGMFGYAQAIVGVAASVSVLGVDGILTRDLLFNKDKTKELLEATSFLRLLGGLFAILLILLIALFEIDSQQKVLLIILSVTLVITPYQTIEAYNVANAQSKANTTAQAMSSTVSFAFKSISILYFNSIILFTLCFILESFLYVSFLKRTFFLQMKSKLRMSYNGPLISKIFKQSLPLLLSALMVAVYMRVDQLMISAMLTKEQLGFYSAATKISEVVYFIPAAVSMAFYPEIISAKKTSDTLYIERVQQLHDVLIAISFAISCAVSITATPLISVMYGIEYAASVPVLAIHVWSSVFVFLGVASSRWLITENLQHYVLNRTILGCAVKVILNFYFIPQYGIVGAAWATIVSQAFASYLGYIFSSKTHPIFIIQTKALFGHFFKSFQKVFHAKTSTNSIICL